jgi:hypothetical protein
MLFFSSPLEVYVRVVLLGRKLGVIIERRERAILFSLSFFLK